MKPIRYRRGYKYVLACPFEVPTGIRPGHPVASEFISLSTDGLLHIGAGYPWDGPSGPTFDTKSAMRCSLPHDAFYQLMREGKLPRSFRKAADEELFRMAIEDGMWEWRAKLWLRMLRKYAEGAADPKNKKRIYIAP